MLKQHNRFFLSCQLALDSAVVTASWFAAKTIIDRGWVAASRPSSLLFKTSEGLLFSSLEQHRLDLSLFALPHLLVVAAIIFCFYKSGLYKSFRDDSHFNDFWAVLGGMLWFSIPAWLAVNAKNEWWVSPQFAALFAGGALLSMSMFRFAVRMALKTLRALGYNQRHLLVVGARRGGQELVHKIRKCRWMGFNIVGFVEDGEDFKGRFFLGIPVLGTIADLPRIIEEYGIDQVYCSLPFNEMDKTLRVAELLTRTTADFRIVPDLVSLTTLNTSLFDIDGLPVLGIRESPLQGFGSLQKRIFDIAFSLAALVSLSWFYLLIGLIIKFTSRGPVFYRQERLGWDGRRFKFLKFRTMRQDAEDETGPVWASPGDDRRTWIGGLLRRTSLDELPQFFNVLAGTMSVVGPRPERPEFIKEFASDIPKYMLRHKTKAGITGWAQVNGWRGDTSLKKRVQYDLYYIENWSMGFDLRIIVDTLFRGLLHKNAY